MLGTSVWATRKLRVNNNRVSPFLEWRHGRGIDPRSRDPSKESRRSAVSSSTSRHSSRGSSAARPVQQADLIPVGAPPSPLPPEIRDEADSARNEDA